MFLSYDRKEKTMLATLIPLFDEKMTVKAYSLFTQKANYLMNPIFLGTGLNDGAGHITGLEIINSIGIESLTKDSDIFVPVTNVSLFSVLILHQFFVFSKRGRGVFLNHDS